MQTAAVGSGLAFQQTDIQMRAYTIEEKTGVCQAAFGEFVKAR